MQDLSKEIRKAKSGLFHTPDSWDSIMEWIERFPKADRPGLVTAAGMAWNLALESSASRVATEDDTEEGIPYTAQEEYDHDNPPPLDPPWWEGR
tara:strand:+ start:536 stop:817 length:282 start_codon:yes stop_codon:yes gene_type:complete